MMKAFGNWRRTAAVLVAVILCVSMLPAGAFAEGEQNSDNNGQAVSENGQGGAGQDGGEDQSGSGEQQPGEGEQGGEGEGDLPVDHIHAMEFVDKEDATCQKYGKKAYYYCTGCQKSYFDRGGEQEITNQEDLIIPIRDHNWDDGVIDPNNLTITIFTCKTCGTTKEEDSESFDPGITYNTAKKVTLNGNTLQFKTKVVTDEDQIKFMDKGRIDHVWVKAGKSRMQVCWKTTKAMKFIDGIILLRKTGSSKVYKQVAEIPFKTFDDGIAEWNPKTSYTDKTAEKKDTPYTYVAVSYLDEDNYRFISSCSDWAEGQTKESSLKTVNTATISEKSADLQYKGTVTLKLTYAKPKTTYNSKSFRWYTDDKKVAKVNSKGKVTATGTGSTTIRGRLSSGDDITCKIKVVGAFKPAAPKLKVDVATESSITMKWSASEHATSYDLYRSDDGLHWKDPVNVEGTSKKITGLTKNHRYTFYVVAVNENHGYVAESKNSNVVNQKAVVKRRATKVTGFPTSKKLTTGKTFSLKLKITSPDKRKAKLQMYSGGKWVTKKTQTLPSGSGKKSVTITFPNDWWDRVSEWRLVIPKSTTSEAYTSATLTITAGRVYQNPSNMVQIKNKISKHGYKYYTSPVLINDMSTRSDCVEALIDTANKYKGDKFSAGKTGAPGSGIDAAGLVIQACYGTGIDLWPLSPATRNSNAVPQLLEAKLQTISDYGTPVEGDFPNVYRGDLIFFKTGNNGTDHVAIYLGTGSLIHASKAAGKVETAKLLDVLDKKGKYKYKITGVRRIFKFY